MFWDFLYRLTPRDDALPQPVQIVSTIAASGAATPVLAEHLVVPQDQVFVVVSHGAAATAGAAQTTERTQLFALSPTGNQVITIAWEDYTVGAGAGIPKVIGEVFGAGPVIIPSGWSLRHTAEFSGAVNINNLNARCMGFLVPRGNFSIPS